MNLRRLFLVLSFCFCLSFFGTFSSYAALASASDALSSPASASDAAPMLLSNDKDYGILPLSSLGSISNTVDYSGVTVEVMYKDSNGNAKIKNSALDASGNFSVRLSDDDEITRLTFYLNRFSLPVAGTYDLSFDFSSSFGHLYSSVWFYSYRENSNAAKEEGSNYLTFQQSNGDIFVPSFCIQLGSVNACSFSIYYDTSTGFVPRWVSGTVKFNFTKSSGAPSVSTPGLGSGDAQIDYQQGVTSGLSNIGDTLKEIVETISMQLDALWNQLYNYMHLPQMEKLEAIRQAIENIRLDVDVDNQDVVNKLDEQIQNDNANTQRVEQAVEKHGNFIIEGLKSLFIPDEEYFSSLFDRLHQFFSDRLGFLYVPFDLLIRLLDAIKDADTAFAGIPFPGIQAGEWVLLAPTTVTFDILNEFPELVQALHFITSVVMIGAFLNLLHRKMEEVMSR